MAHVSEFLAAAAINEPVTFGNLTVFPLIVPDRSQPAYITLDEAVAAGTVTLTETSESGTVPRVRLTNDGDRPVLLLDGEELIGAKQNRVLNVTILAPAHRSIDIPVSCVEMGRWAYRSDKFSPSGRAVYASLRAMKSGRVSGNLAMGLEADANQGEIWDDIAMKSARMEAESPTRAMDSMYECYEASIDGFVKAFRPVVDQSGAVFAIDGAIVGFDLFDHPSTFEKLFPRLLQSYALDALDGPYRPFTAPTLQEGKDFVAEAANDAEATGFPAIGLGTDIRLAGRALTGSALEANGTVVHACAFRLAEEDSHRGPGPRQRAQRFSRASVRRSWQERRGRDDE